MGEGSQATIKSVWEAISTTASENMNDLWTVLAAVVGTLAVLWFARLGLNLVKRMANSAAS